LHAKYSTFYELGKITLCRGGTYVSEVRVLLVGHSADKSFRAGIEQRVEYLALALVEAGLRMMHPEAGFLQYALDRAGTLGASGHDLLEEPFQPIRCVEIAARQRL
jgi:hypothetical protein